MTKRHIFTLLLILFATATISAPIMAVAQEADTVTQEIQFRAPAASNVSLVWGINGWQPFDNISPPANSEFINGTMHTPMLLEGDHFVSTLTLPTDAVLDFGFLILGKADGSATYIWEIDGDTDFQTTVSTTPIEITSTTDLAATDITPFTTVIINYHAPEANQASLLWGVNDWHVLPQQLRPNTTTIEDGSMLTPLTRQNNDIFTIELLLLEGMKLDFVFNITELYNNQPVDVWHVSGDEDVSTSYHWTIEPNTTIDIFPDHSIHDAIFSQTFAINWQGWVSVIVTAVLLFTLIFYLPNHSTWLSGQATQHTLPANIMRLIYIGGIPLILLIIVYIIIGIYQSPAGHWLLQNPDPFGSYIFNENNSVELLTFGFLFIAGICSLWLSRNLWQLEKLSLSTLFYTIFGAILLFIAMEEIAWGQWFFGFATPDSLQGLNQQGELTLHNIDGLQGTSEYFSLAFGLGGLIGIVLGRQQWAEKIGTPISLIFWFGIITLLAGTDVLARYLEINPFIKWGAEQLSEVVEMLISIAAFFYIWLNVRRLGFSQKSAHKKTNQFSHQTFDLLRELVSRDMKLRYKRSVLGILWSLLNPIFQLIVFGFIFSIVLPLNIPSYASFVFTGIIVWTWFQQTLMEATTVIIQSPDLIRRPGFPLDILPIVSITTNLIHFALALPILFIFLLFNGSPLNWTLLLLPILILLQFMFTLGLAYLVAAVHVYFRDTQHLLGIVLMLAFYLTPIFYEASFVPDSMLFLYNLNPMVHFVDGYRAILLNGVLPNMGYLLIIGLISAGLLYLCRTFFISTSYRFVDEL